MCKNPIYIFFLYIYYGQFKIGPIFIALIRSTLYDLGDVTSLNEEDLLKLENIGVRVLVKSIGSIKAFVERRLRGINVNIPSMTRLSLFIADTLCNPRYTQLSFNI